MAVSRLFNPTNAAAVAAARKRGAASGRSAAVKVGSGDAPLKLRLKPDEYAEKYLHFYGNDRKFFSQFDGPDDESLAELVIEWLGFEDVPEEQRTDLAYKVMPHLFQKLKL